MEVGRTAASSTQLSRKEVPHGEEMEKSLRVLEILENELMFVKDVSTMNA
jgi:hypothetical protein